MELSRQYSEIQREIVILLDLYYVAAFICIYNVVLGMVCFRYEVFTFYLHFSF